MYAAVIQILFLTQKSQMFLRISLQIELLVVPILLITCTANWLSENILTCLFWKYVLICTATWLTENILACLFWK